MSDRSGLFAADPQDEIIAAMAKALDKAHDLLSSIVTNDGRCTPQIVDKCQEWLEGEYDPGTHRARPCEHNWAKAVLDGSIWCTRCDIRASTDCQ